MPMSANVIRAAAATAVLCAGLGGSALASGGGSGDGGHKPTIHSTSMGNGKEGGIAVEVGATHAKRVIATVGPRKNRERVELTRAGREGKLTFWEGTLSDRGEQCTRLRVTAINRFGRDERDDPVCIFGEPEPEPPGGTVPLP
jgi:hypothetical protein